MWRFLLGSFCLVFSSFLIVSCSSNYTVIESKCGRCHKSEIVYSKKRNLEDWKRVVYAMKIRGLVITITEEEELFNVLKEKGLITY